MELTVLGSGTCELRRERSSPAYHVQAGSTSLLLDLGQGALRRLLQTGRAPAQVNGILLSHHHPDHISDLIPLLFALKYAPDMAQARMELVAHAEVLSVLENLQGIFSNWITPNGEGLHKTAAASGSTVNIGGVMIRAAKAAHMECSLAFRLDFGGRSLAYLGDSEACTELVELADGVDLLITHCAADDHKPKPGHIGPTASGKLAAESGAKALLLSHFYRDVDPDQAVSNAAAQFKGLVWAAKDHMRLSLDNDTPRLQPEANLLHI